MADLYGRGCEKCDKEIAAVLREMPVRGDAISTEDYHARYGHLPAGTRPKAYLDGAHIPHTIWTIPGEDGWLLAATGEGGPCHCGSNALETDLWRGNVELR